jgi:hypothetical protein
MFFVGRLLLTVFVPDDAPSLFVRRALGLGRDRLEDQRS